MTEVVEVYVEDPVSVSIPVEMTATVAVETPGIQGPSGPPGDKQITVSATPPENPQINDLWIDIS